jgi:hypothetical protein
VSVARDSGLVWRGLNIGILGDSHLRGDRHLSKGAKGAKFYRYFFWPPWFYRGGLLKKSPNRVIFWVVLAGWEGWVGRVEVGVFGELANQSGDSHLGGDCHLARMIDFRVNCNALEHYLTST